MDTDMTCRPRKASTNLRSASKPRTRGAGANTKRACPERAIGVIKYLKLAGCFTAAFFGGVFSAQALAPRPRNKSTQRKKVEKQKVEKTCGMSHIVPGNCDFNPFAVFLFWNKTYRTIFPYYHGPFASRRGGCSEPGGGSIGAGSAAPTRRFVRPPCCTTAPGSDRPLSPLPARAGNRWYSRRQAPRNGRNRLKAP